MAWRSQWNALADKNGDDAEVKLVNFAFIKERSDDLPASHHPDILPRLLTELSSELLYGLVEELYFRDCSRCQERSCEDIVLNLRIEY